MGSTPTDTICQMNHYGAHRIPFLFLIDFEMQQPHLFRWSEIDATRIRFTINGVGHPTLPSPLPENIQFDAVPMPFERYQMAFQRVLREIQAGNSYLLNLTFPTRLKTNLTLLDIFNHSQAPYKLWWRDRFVVFSPEIFVQIYNGQIASYPMKGTIDADLPHARETILADEKELAEHVTIVDLIRNDLNRVAKRVRVEKFRYVEHLQTRQKNLLQVSSKIVGELPPDYPAHIGDVIFQLLPAGSISGAPKKKTVEIIRAAEQQSRGYYTGIFGYFDGRNLDSGVLIRYIEQRQGQLFFRSGGGITHLSQVEAEYRELLDKIYVPIIRDPQS